MRLFVAISLNAELKKELGAFQSKLQVDSAKLRWLRQSDLHLTLKFLGQVDNSRLDEIKSAVSTAALRAEAFSLTLKGTGVFPPRGKARIVWAGIGECDQLLQLQQVCEEVFTEHGFEREQREFRAHITLARVKQDNSRGSFREQVLEAEVLELTQRVSELCLYQSITASGGAEYNAIHIAPFSIKN